MKIYVDMDGVLTDFVAQLAPFGYDGDNWPDDKLWPTVKSIPNFWRDMPWLTGGKILWRTIMKLKPTILTAPARDDPSCKMGKLEWVCREIGNDVPVIFARACDKCQYAGNGDILIDDMERNIKQWRDAGGIGILHIGAAKTIEELKKIFKIPGTKECL